MQRGLSVIEDGIAHEVRRAEDLGLLSPHTDADQATAIVTLAAQGLMAMARAGVASPDLRARARATIAGITTKDADVD